VRSQTCRTAVRYIGRSRPHGYICLPFTEGDRAADVPEPSFFLPQHLPARGRRRGSRRQTTVERDRSGTVHHPSSVRIRNFPTRSSGHNVNFLNCGEARISGYLSTIGETTKPFLRWCGNELRFEFQHQVLVGT